MQKFDFDNIQDGDKIRFNGIVAEYTEHTSDENKSWHGKCFYCAYGDIDCTNIPCDNNNVWKNISKASWKKATDEKK